MNATEIINTLYMEKTALNKARALYEAENLSTSNAKRLFRNFADHNPVNVVHARINAKAKRQAGGVAPTKKMDLHRYQRYERPDTLPKAREILDSGRITRRAGHNNAAVISAAKREGWIHPNLLKSKKLDVHTDGGDAGITMESNMGWTLDPAVHKPGLISGIDIGVAGMGSNKISQLAASSLKPQDVKKLTPIERKETRALAARHELSGELHDSIRQYRSVEKHKLPVDYKNSGMKFYQNSEIGTHITPNVLQGDHNMVRKMSPLSKMMTEDIRERSPTNFNYNNPDTGRSFRLMEDQLKNILSDRHLDAGFSKPMSQQDKTMAITRIHKLMKTDPDYTRAFLQTKPILKTEY